MSRPANRPDRSVSQRVPLGQRNVMTVPPHLIEEGYVYRIINDKYRNAETRLADAMKGGWEFVEGDDAIGDPRSGDATKLDSRVARHVGNGVTGYLMRIRKDWYDEDQKVKQDKVDETEKAMKPDKSRGQYGSGLTDE